MYYPTIQIQETKQIHIVKNKNHCGCGLVYNPFPTLTRKDLKMIQMRPVDQVTCEKCQALLKEAD